MSRKEIIDMCELAEKLKKDLKQKKEAIKHQVTKTKEQLESEELRRNFENFVSNDFRKDNSQKNNLSIVPLIMNAEPKMCIFIGNTLNCD